MATPLVRWVEEQASLTKPDSIYWCDGSEEEARRLVEIGIKEEKIDGHPVFSELNQKTYPRSYYHRSHLQEIS